MPLCIGTPPSGVLLMVIRAGTIDQLIPLMNLFSFQIQLSLVVQLINDKKYLI